MFDMLQDLVSLSQLVLQMHEQQQVTWLGGICNHEDVFQPLYRMLLALHTAASSQAMLDMLPLVPQRLQSAQACLQRVEPSPVLSALLLSTIERWEGTAVVQQQVRYLTPACTVLAFAAEHVLLQYSVSYNS